jgi:hypothetical protein
MLWINAKSDAQTYHINGKTSTIKCTLSIACLGKRPAKFQRTNLYQRVNGPLKKDSHTVPFPHG